MTHLIIHKYVILGCEYVDLACEHANYFSMLFFPLFSRNKASKNLKRKVKTCKTYIMWQQLTKKNPIFQFAVYQ